MQQVRNYVDIGMLPPAGRAESGYRIYTQQHVDALVTARAVIQGHGWLPALNIMSAVNSGDLRTALTLVDKGHAELVDERERIDRTLGAFETIVTSDLPVRPRRSGSHRVGEVAKAVGVRAWTIRAWDHRGLLKPERERTTGYRSYNEGELRKAYVISILRAGDYSFGHIQAVLSEMDRTGNPERVRAELARREHELEARSLGRLRASSRLFDYLERHGLA